MQIVEQLGRIDKITLPSGWVEVQNQDEELITYKHPQETDVQMSFYYRGKPISSRTADSLKKLFSLPVHKLDSDEHLSIETILRDAAETEYFDLRDLRTDVINGEKVLIAEGFWKLSKLDSYAVFVASEEDESWRIDELYYLAPPDKFQMYFSQFKNALDSIQWAI